MPRLSVVVTIVDGGATLERCLAALMPQCAAAEVEILAPWDVTVRGIREVAERFPAVDFVAMGRVWTRRSTSSAAGRHELVDRRRAAGLAAAKGEIVALLEDRGVPRRDWVEGVLAAHANLPYAVVGGPIDVVRTGRLAWAVYACDFGRYQPPIGTGPRAYLSDVNVSYKRRAVEATRELWRERYQETIVHWALASAGETLYLADLFVIDQARDGLALGALLAERFAAGRFFAATRARGSSRVLRLLRACAAPALPVLLLARYLRERRGAGRRRPPRGTAAVVALFTVAASIGEIAGDLTGSD